MAVRWIGEPEAGDRLGETGGGHGGWKLTETGAMVILCRLVGPRSCHLLRGCAPFLAEEPRSHAYGPPCGAGVRGAEPA